MALTAFDQRALEISRSGAQRGRDSQSRRDQYRHGEREEEHRQIDRDILKAWQVRRRQGHQRVHTPEGRNDAEPSPCDGKQKRFGKELTHQPPSPRPQRRANAQFFLAGGGLRQEQVGHVGASDQQQKPYRSEQGQQRGTHLCGQRVSKRRDGYVRHHGVLAVLLLELSGDARKLGARLGRRDAAAQPPHHAPIVGTAAGQTFGELARHPNVTVERELEARW